MSAHDRDDGTRIHSTGEIGPKWNIALHPYLHCVFEKIEKVVSSLFFSNILHRRAEVYFPIHLGFEISLPPDRKGTRQELLYLLKGGLGCAYVLQPEVLVQALVIKVF